MSDTVTIYIDGQAYDVPKGANLVDVAKFHADEDIPVFCYHPKMEPVGMCRMCLVEMGFIQKDRATGETMTDDNGDPQVRWFPKLQTACTQLVADGMVVRTNTPEVIEGRDNIVEFLLTSHPLDCPICDKGGECPLQNLTMRHGSGISNFHFEDKLKLDKHVPLGELVYLDRERCIQCARCVRFCDELVGDPVLGFHERGRKLQIVTISETPFDTYFSGNTTDICPVGALTTADFRFGARPWELKEVPSIDPYGPEGANISLSTRLDRDAGGVVKIKRVMPRQNEYVNEIWISDKTRFGHHYTLNENRLKHPLVRVGDRLIESEWAHTLEVTAKHLQDGGSVGAIVGSNLSNEDLWELRKLVDALGGGQLGIFPATMSGAEAIAQVGVAKGTNFTDMGKGTTIVIVASDLEETAPIWYLRTKTAGDRGAEIVVVNARPTKLDKYATHILNYDYGDATGAVQSLYKGKARAGWNTAKKLIKASENVVVICGNDGLTLTEHGELMKACANLLIDTKHVGRPNNGLLAVWEGANVQGSLDMGFSAEATLELYNNPPEVLLVAGCDPLGEDVRADKLGKAKLVIATSLFETATTEIADVVLPSVSFAERHGTFTSGERRVQRFYAAQGVVGACQDDWHTFAQLRHAIDGSAKPRLAAGIMTEIAQNLPSYADISYKALAQVERQFPDVGGDDLYYGGTAYKNDGGLGVQYPVASETEDVSLFEVNAAKTKYSGLTLMPITRLYDKGWLFKYSEMMNQRIGENYVVINLATADKQKVVDGAQVALTVEGHRYEAMAVVSDTAPKGFVFMPRRMTDAPGHDVPAPIETLELIAEPVAAEG